MGAKGGKGRAAAGGGTAGNDFFSRMLAFVERAGNTLPHPATIFLVLALAVVVASAVASWAGISAVHPGTGKTITVVNLLTVEGLHQILNKTVSNFTSFAPLGTVLVALLGIGVAEGSGLLGTLAPPPRPLGAAPTPHVRRRLRGHHVEHRERDRLRPPDTARGVLFLAAGRHPIAGMAAAFAGVSGGYSANLVLGTIDPLLAGLTQEAAHIVDPAYSVNPACNYYFLAVSTVPRRDRRAPGSPRGSSSRGSAPTPERRRRTASCGRSSPRSGRGSATPPRSSSSSRPSCSGASCPNGASCAT